MKMIESSIITIGDEILYGQTIDTNSAFMAKQLETIGVAVKEIITVSDERQSILDALDRSFSISDIVLVTGGLGPTQDDITRNTLSEYFSSELVINEVIAEKLESFYTSRGRAFGEVQLKMAYFPEAAEIIMNPVGTAAAMYFREKNKVLVSMPGVPHEMKTIMTNSVIPKLSDSFKLPELIHRYFYTAGRGESQLAEYIKEVENALPDHIKLAYLPGLGSVKLRLTAKGNDAKTLNKELDSISEQLNELIGRHIYSTDNESHAFAVGQLLKERSLSLISAESCTGGSIAKDITAVPGCSSYFLGGIVAYSNDLKVQLLSVSEKTIADYGAVSEQVVKQMVTGAIENYGADIAVASSGIAGPTGGSDKKPVGLVYIGVGNKKEVVVKKFTFAVDRKKHVVLSTMTALEMLRRFMLNTLKR